MRISAALALVVIALSIANVHAQSWMKLWGCSSSEAASSMGLVAMGSSSNTATCVDGFSFLVNQEEKCIDSAPVFESDGTIRWTRDPIFNCDLAVKVRSINGQTVKSDCEWVTLSGADTPCPASKYVSGLDQSVYPGRIQCCTITDPAATPAPTPAPPVTPAPTPAPPVTPAPTPAPPVTPAPTPAPPVTPAPTPAPPVTPAPTPAPPVTPAPTPAPPVTPAPTPAPPVTPAPTPAPPVTPAPTPAPPVTPAPTPAPPVTPAPSPVPPVTLAPTPAPPVTPAPTPLPPATPADTPSPPVTPAPTPSETPQPLPVTPAPTTASPATLPPVSPAAPAKQLELRATFGIDIDDAQQQRGSILQAVQDTFSDEEQVEITQMYTGSVVIVFSVITRRQPQQIQSVVVTALLDPAHPLRSKFLGQPGSVSVHELHPQKNPLQFYVMVVAPLAVLLSIAIIVGVYTYRKRQGKLDDQMINVGKVNTEVRCGRLVINGQSIGKEDPHGLDKVFGGHVIPEGVLAKEDEEAIALQPVDEDDEALLRRNASAAGLRRRRPSKLKPSRVNHEFTESDDDEPIMRSPIIAELRAQEPSTRTVSEMQLTTSERSVSTKQSDGVSFLGVDRVVE